jgi:hypothetical protein
MKLLIMQFPPLSRHFIPLRTKYCIILYNNNNNNNNNNYYINYVFTCLLNRPKASYKVSTSKETNKTNTYKTNKKE